MLYSNKLTFYHETSAFINAIILFNAFYVDHMLKILNSIMIIKVSLKVVLRYIDIPLLADFVKLSS